LRTGSFLVGTFILVMTLFVDGTMFTNGLISLAIFSFIGTLLLFASSIIWLIYRDDTKLHFRRIWLVIPLSVFGLGLAFTFQQLRLQYIPTNENLGEVGNLVMSRYQIGMWCVSALILFMFVVAASLVTRHRS
jgi:hypothetical protein